jgi:hypothetical protein
VVELSSDDKLYNVKFSGPRAEKLQGIFSDSAVSDCTFTGVKTSVRAELDNNDIAEEWADRNERASEPASRRHFGGWRGHNFQEGMQNLNRDRSVLMKET